MEGLSDPEVKLERAAAKEQRSRDDCPIENLMDIYFSPSSRNFYKAAYTADFFLSATTKILLQTRHFSRQPKFHLTELNKCSSNDSFLLLPKRVGASPAFLYL